jgi:hypothetical protein
MMILSNNKIIRAPISQLIIKYSVLNLPAGIDLDLNNSRGRGRGRGRGNSRGNSRDRGRDQIS